MTGESVASGRIDAAGAARRTAPVREPLRGDGDRHRGHDRRRHQDPLIQRRALRWKLGLTPVVNQAAFLSEPEAAYVAMLTVATSMHDFLTTGGGAEAFGEQQKLAVDASTELLAAAVELGDRFLSKKELARVTQEVETLVRAQPMRGEFVAEKVQSLVTAAEATPSSTG